MKYLRDTALGLFITAIMVLAFIIVNKVIYIAGYGELIISACLLWWAFILCKIWTEDIKNKKYEIKMFSTYLYDKGNPDTNVNKDLQEEYNNGWEIAGNIERIAGSTTVKLLIPLKRKIK